MLGPELVTYLASMGFGTVNTNLFYEFIPPDPDVLISVISYGGALDEPNLGNGGTLTRLEYPRFQLVVRGVRQDNDGPALKCIQARAALVAVLNTTLSNVKYLGINALSPPSFLMRDENFRVYWSCNFQAIKAPSIS